MAQLKNKSKNTLLASRVEVASSILSRSIGLLGRTSLPADQTLWIKPCSSIHTCFMRFKIDVAFVDKNLKVTRIDTAIPAWRFIFSTFKSDSVFEFTSGVLNSDKIEIGDQLDVDC